MGQVADQGRVLSPELDADPYDPGEEDPAKSRALESSLWELQVSPACRVPRHLGLPELPAPAPPRSARVWGPSPPGTWGGLGLCLESPPASREGCREVRLCPRGW